MAIDEEQVVISKTIKKQDIEITAEKENLWSVQIAFPSLSVTEKEMLARTRDAKRIIARNFNVPLELLELREVIDKAPRPEGLSIHISIGRIEMGRGKPRVRLIPLGTASGSVFPDMIAELDFYYLDESDTPITMDRLRTELVNKGVSLEMCNYSVMQRTIETVHERKSLVTKLEVARGSLPEEGRDASLIYSFCTDSGGLGVLEGLRALKKVREKNVLCEKAPARNGTVAGRNVSGENIPALQGMDFQLVAGSGVKLSDDGNTLSALRTGLAILNRTVEEVDTPGGKRTVTTSIEVSVKQLVKMNAEEIGDLVLDDSVDINGTLKEGKTVSTPGEVIVNGDVEEGVILHAGADITIHGQIKGGEITSECSVFSKSDAQNSTITAASDVNIKGDVVNSAISGRKVKMGDVSGSNIEVGYKVCFNRISDDEGGQKTEICVGRDSFYNKKLEANQEYIDNMSANLQHIGELFGEDVTARFNPSNIRTLLFDHLKRLRRRGLVNMNNELVKSFKKLLEAIKPIKNSIVNRAEVIDNLQKEASAESLNRPVIVARMGVKDPFEININGKKTTIEATDDGTAISINGDGDIIIHKLRPPSRREVNLESVDADQEKPT
ncbi:hypothetical protein CEE37_00505 [candidate division LCP-89 bacterium B3_LCP]|uniref:Flagellar Assembly Protein A N-terminal region domain-containing protein n=1 Tax=candidate division LCP-89 bacterium B3_LCP TaxID=2012998 RepID=A0A532V4X7_UNCL8|nr:MAG: hypothetical protein CEE37_00505 [candidate division LCP-89 bacterium B3_LCP]